MYQNRTLTHTIGKWTVTGNIIQTPLIETSTRILYVG